MSELISKDSALNCFTDWIDQYGHEHTADEDAVYQRIAGLKSIENCADAISRKMAIDVMCEMMYHWFGGNPKDEIREIVRELKKLPAVQPDHNADISKKVTDEDCISRRVAIELCDWYDNPSLHDDLEKLPSVQPDHNADIGKKADGDCISRQAAIDAYGDWYVEEGTEEGFIGTVKQLLEGLPSAQPATNCSEIPNGSDDTISRQAAIEALDEWFKKTVHSQNMSAYEYDSAYAQGEIDAYVAAIDTLKTLPSARPDHVADVSKKVSILCAYENDVRRP